MIEDFLKFIKNATNQYEATREMSKILDEAGFIHLYLGEDFKLECGKNYYVTKNNSSLIAFKLPKDNSDLNYQISACHTDSPTFKIKPNNKIEIKNHYVMLNTEVYGGPIYSSFFDRPLSISGRVFVLEGDEIKEKLFNYDDDLLVIPNECIHFNRDVNNGKNYNPQIDLLPLLSEKGSLEDLIAETLKISNEQILSHDLTLYSRYRGSLIGKNKEFFMAPQIDDLESAYGCLMGFIKGNSDKSCNLFVAFDNEEVGSRTKQGAASTMLKDMISLIHKHIGISPLEEALESSFIVSCDNAHAVHPNNLAHTDTLNCCYMNSGIVIKHNANQSYTTDGLSDALFSHIMNKNGIKIQHFTNRSDIRGGGTLGSISLSQLSIPSVDIGLAQLAMHSCCETAGSYDLDYLIDGMAAFYSTHIKKTREGYKF